MPSIVNATTTAGVAVSGDNSGVLALQTNNGTTALTITTGQNVGIGVTATTQKLWVNGNTCVPDNSAFGFHTNPSAGSISNYYSGNDASNYLRMFTGGSERMRIDSSGQIGINTTTPADRLTVNGNIALNGGFDYVFSNGGGSGGSLNAGIGFDGINTRVLFYTGSTERMRITSAGNVLVGTTSTTPNPGVVMQTDGNISCGNSAGGSGFEFLSLRRSAVQIGGITQNGTTAVQFNTTSDYRLKENIVPMTGALEKVAQLKPVTYKWKSDGSDGQGFIAHELQAVVPDCVSGEKNAVETYTDEDGNEQTRPKYQGIDTSFLVATLTAAIQELNAKVDAQAAEIAALKGAK
jgi:hypothetical protein